MLVPYLFTRDYVCAVFVFFLQIFAPLANVGELARRRSRNRRLFAGFSLIFAGGFLIFAGFFLKSPWVFGHFFLKSPYVFADFFLKSPWELFYKKC